jgi:hypothetical protein
VTSQKARISVGNPASPPEILDIPSELTVEQGSAGAVTVHAVIDGLMQKFVFTPI